MMVSVPSNNISSAKSAVLPSYDSNSSSEDCLVGASACETRGLVMWDGSNAMPKSA